MSVADSDGLASGEPSGEVVDDMVLRPVSASSQPTGPMVLMRPGAEIREITEEDDEEEDETFSERLWGLSEMFPECVRSATRCTTSAAWTSTAWLYSVGRVGLWVAASSAAILAFPVMFETERAQMEEQQMQQERQILLGPNAAVSSGINAGMMGAMSQMAPPPVAPAK